MRFFLLLLVITTFNCTGNRTWTETQQQSFMDTADSLGWFTLNKPCVLEWVPKKYSYPKAIKKLHEDDEKLKVWFDGCF